ncbi:Methyltransferase domain-containing protein [Peptoclostridium litorale DSM 5388]|uniref:Methylase involved in ubiquinone/menaquinone biosynthesis n=1 Tax=Peptoclostridium litorale DSM 5388 TaxID=1121324 RepID=A0A069RML0_PEPLI|nr:class I SAM-dependent methyltransferase [Peptoclostridium litorale]KDR95427.1 methylase involved in ubiquinone/menaquinone biosynthesis [Peptoclostridium litorale DSM 5388]SIO18980.1 Methyltransferase domain-containing protein [Peptoclostridium litorale DSM 5388]
MSHIFDENMRKKLEGPKRQEEMKPIQTLKKLGLEKGDVILDIGCGIGFFSIPASEIVGESGKVYAADISEVMLKELSEKISKQGITNIVPVLSDGNSISTGGQPPTFCLLVNVVHEVDDKEDLIGMTHSLMDKGGKIAVIDFKKIPTDGGPPLEFRLSQGELENLLKSQGYTIAGKGDISERFYFVTGEK